MFYHQTVHEYLENPMGKGSTAISNRNLIRTDLNNRYDKLIAKHKDFKHYKFYDGSKFYYHFLIPSETERDNTYDVVIELSDPESSFTKDINLNRYYMRVFSNCPSFVFTYAHVFNRYGLLIDSLKNKYDNIVLESEPSIKNPGSIINYEKSIYFACRYLELHKSLMNKVSLSLVTSVGLKKHLQSIRNTDTIQLEILKANNKLKEEKRKKEEKKPKKEDPLRINKRTGQKTIGVNKIKPSTKIKPKKKI